MNSVRSLIAKFSGGGVKNNNKASDESTATGTAATAAAAPSTGKLKLRDRPYENETKFKYDIAWLMEQLTSTSTTSTAAHADFVKGMSIDRAVDVVASIDPNNAKHVEVCELAVDALENEDLFDMEEIFLGKILDVRSKSKSKDNLAVVIETKNRLARCLFKQKKYSQSSKHYQELVEMYKEHHNVDEDEIAQTLMNLAVSLHEQKQHGEAEKKYRESMQIREKTIMPQQQQQQRGVQQQQIQDVANVAANLMLTVHNLATAIHEQGKLAEAESMYRKALDILDNVEQSKRLPGQGDVGEVHDADLDAEFDPIDMLQDHSAMTKNNLGSLLHARGSYEEAENLFRQSINTLGHEHESVAHAVNNLSKSLHQQQKMEFNQVGGAHGNIVCSSGVISKKEDNAETFEIEARFYERIADSVDDPISEIVPKLVRVVWDSSPRILMIEDITQGVLSESEIDAARPRSRRSDRKSKPSKSADIAAGEKESGAKLSHASAGPTLHRKQPSYTAQLKRLQSNPSMIRTSSAYDPLKRFVFKNDQGSPQNGHAEQSPQEVELIPSKDVGKANCSIMDCKLGFRSFKNDAPNKPESSYFKKYEALEKEIGVDAANRVWATIPKKSGEASRPACLGEGKLGKHDYLSFRDATTTSLQHGFRLTALTSSDFAVSQDESRSITSIEQFQTILTKFLVAAPAPAEVAKSFVKDLRKILQVMTNEHSMISEYDFIGTSLLFVYRNGKTTVKWIDFANVSKHPLSPDRNGLVEGVESLIRCMEKESIMI